MYQVVETNQATISLLPQCQNCDQLLAIVHPPGCFSSSLTDPITQVANVNVDTENKTMTFETRFVYKVDAWPYGKGQTGDCTGAGVVQTVIGALPPGTYAVVLGRTPLGEYTITEGELPSQQFSSEPTP